MSRALEESRTQVLRKAAELAERQSGDDLAAFLSRYYKHVATEDLLARQPEDLLGAALSHRALAQQRPVGTASVRVFTPSVDEHGWSTGHTVVEIVTDDMPFLVDSVSMELGRQARAIHLVVHPQLTVRRDATGRLVEILDVGMDRETPQDLPYDAVVESWMHIEIDRESDPAALAEISSRVEQVLADVRVAVEDWPKLCQTATSIAEDLAANPPHGVDVNEVKDARDLLLWLADGHFTFVGYREYALVQVDGEDALEPVPSTGLGILRYDPQMTSESFSRLSSSQRAKAHDKHLLVVTKANSRSTVHRLTYLDYIGVKRFDADGNVTGERRFLGLFTSSAYTESVRDVPVLGRKIDDVLARGGFSPASHSGKDLLTILETYPRDELFQISLDDLYETATAVMYLEERRRTRLFLRRDHYGRFMSCLVYIPRDRYTTAVRLRMEEILRKAFNGETVDYTTRVSESLLARLHFVVRPPQGMPVPDVDADELERRLVDATRTWVEDLAEALRTEYGEERAARLVGLYGRAYPEAYKEEFSPRVAVSDLRHIEALEGPGALRLNLYEEPGAQANERRFKLYTTAALSLTRVLPVFTHLGVEVVDERPYELTRSDGVVVQVYDFGLARPGSDEWSRQKREQARELFQDAFAAAWSGAAESDGLNGLVLGAGLTWRQVSVLRGYTKYLRQTGSTFSQEYVEAALLANCGITSELVALFEERFDPDRYEADPVAESRNVTVTAMVQSIKDGLELVDSLDQDRILRSLLALVRATLRTNYFQRGSDGNPKAYTSYKLDPKNVPDLPAPRPAYEIWVYSPRVEGVHLRFGKVARGGLRWSDRREDFRTEVLGLVKAQMVKNAVIVPTGAKGGFVPKTGPSMTQDREGWLAEGIACYTTFISALLDLTDNLVGGEVVPPGRVVRHDEDDTYLVVAADKGTATFSDIANGVAIDYGFWLGDAFASGGSAGYDHKAMGITAKGAWESVKRHFREIGQDTQAHDFTVVGVGDMSGDVFGNGMLLSHHIRLVAAFDHRHIFVDPNPVADTSYAERRRLFDLPRSSWDDYDRSLISEGGGIWPRAAKAVPINERMVAALGLAKGTTTMTPAELMKAILLAPVDLLWNGGIGTYVKASTESNAEVGDRANDSIRVNGGALRCRVVGEGGNLGLTQLGRIEAARHGVRVNTDAIDNSAGVDCSDHEVNIKILLGQVVTDGDLTTKQRNALLVDMTDDVSRLVLRDNYEQNVLLGNARAQEHSMLPVHQRLIHWLEERGELDRAIEYLPSDVDIARRHDEGLGLTSPEFSVLVAYAKLVLKRELLATDLPDDPWLEATLRAYFPAELVKRYGDRLGGHPLRREIVINSVVNSMVNRGGITFAFRAEDETGATAEQVARAYLVAREIYDLSGYVADVEALDNQVPTAAQTALYLEFRRLLDRAVRWFIQSRPGRMDIQALADRFRDTVRELSPQLPELLVGAEHRRWERRCKELVKVGAPEEMTRRAAALLDGFSLLDVTEIAGDTGRPAAEVAPIYFTLSERYGVDAMLGRITALPREDRWDALARASLRIDLYAALESLTVAVLQSTHEGEPHHRITQWERANAEALARARDTIEEVAKLERTGIAALSVALRSLRAVIRSSATTST
ncbi:MAG: NAD-glutamate dehydrogenase [Actinomycetales bacterium]